MKKSVLFAACAGLAIASSAMAQTLEPLPQQYSHVQILRPVSISTLDRSVTIMLDGSGVSNRAVSDVYLNTAAGYFSTGSAPRTLTLDDGNFTGIDAAHSPGGGGNIDILNADIGFVCTALPAGGTGFAMACQFYDTIDGTHPTNVAQGFLAGFILNFNQPGATGAYATGLLDLTGLFPTGIHFPDDDWAYSITMMTTGGDPSGYPGNAEVGCTALFAGGSPNPEGFEGALIGFSDDIYARDTQPNGAFTGGVANGGVDPNEFRFFGGAPNYANFYLNLQADVGPAGCPADFDGDGTVDFFDYDAFVVCFEDPTCTGADFDGDGTTDFFDYDAFVVAFETPCP